MGFKLSLQSWQLWALFSAVFAACTAIFGKLGVAAVPSNQATLLRTIVVLFTVAALVRLTGQWQPLSQIPPRTYFFLVFSGLGTGASWLCYFHALKLGEAARVAPIDKLSVVLVAVFSVMFLGERLSPVQWLGIIAMFGGALLVSA